MWLVALSAFCGIAVAAQEITASLRGVVLLDASGGVVTKATVTATQQETGLQRSTATHAQGAFVLVELPVGHYRLEAEGAGFKKYVQEGISLSVNQTPEYVKSPAYQQWDFSAVKTIPIHEATSLQFRAEFFNIFNNVNFHLPNNDIASPDFGLIQSAQPGRIVQLALKFLF